jgi:hypothetical protein
MHARVRAHTTHAHAHNIAPDGEIASATGDCDNGPSCPTGQPRCLPMCRRRFCSAGARRVAVLPHVAQCRNLCFVHARQHADAKKACRGRERRAAVPCAPPVFARRAIPNAGRSRHCRRPRGCPRAVVPGPAAGHPPIGEAASLDGRARSPAPPAVAPTTQPGPPRPDKRLHALSAPATLSRGRSRNGRSRNGGLPGSAAAATRLPAAWTGSWPVVRAPFSPHKPINIHSNTLKHLTHTTTPWTARWPELSDQRAARCRQERLQRVLITIRGGEEGRSARRCAREQRERQRRLRRRPLAMCTLSRRAGASCRGLSCRRAWGRRMSAGGGGGGDGGGGGGWPAGFGFSRTQPGDDGWRLCLLACMHSGYAGIAIQKIPRWGLAPPTIL